jgi:hypothetical protein
MYGGRAGRGASSFSVAMDGKKTFENEIDLNWGLKNERSWFGSMGKEMRMSHGFDSGWTDKMLFGGGHRTVYNLF